MTLSRRFASARNFSPGKYSRVPARKYSAVACIGERQLLSVCRRKVPRSRSRGHYSETIDNIQSRRNRIPQEEDFRSRTGGWTGARNLFSTRQAELPREFGKPRTVTAVSTGGGRGGREREDGEIGSPPLPPLFRTINPTTRRRLSQVAQEEFLPRRERKTASRSIVPLTFSRR